MAGVAGSLKDPEWVKAPILKFADTITTECTMTWTKPEAEVVAVTMEVTAYVATL
jgi:hypothetical protein